jgi:hypothetical protein
MVLSVEPVQPGKAVADAVVIPKDKAGEEAFATLAVQWKSKVFEKRTGPLTRFTAIFFLHVSCLLHISCNTDYFRFSLYKIINKERDPRAKKTFGRNQGSLVNSAKFIATIADSKAHKLRNFTNDLIRTKPT